MNTIDFDEFQLLKLNNLLHETVEEKLIYFLLNQCPRLTAFLFYQEKYISITANNEYA